jgi:dTDP-4-amino-4,6-dideoxygalactose transaminase
MKFPSLKVLNYQKKFIQSISSSIEKNQMTLGPKCKELENMIREKLKVRHVVLTTSGTSALMMATICSGLKPNQLGLCSNLAWVAATNPILIMGGKLLVADTIKNTELIDFKKLNYLIKLKKPKLVVLIHLNGQSTYNNEFDRLKKKLKFFVIEDAAQAFLTVSQNKHCGTKYDIGCFSLSVAKPIHMAYGGFCVTNNSKLADKLIAARNNGVFEGNEKLSQTLGLNLKPSDLHAAIGIENLKKFDERKKILLNLYNLYKKTLKNKKFNFIKLKGKESAPNFAQILIKPDQKQFFLEYCLKNGIGTAEGVTTIVETKMIKGSNENFPHSNYVARNLIRIPFGTGYKKNEIKKVIKILNEF